MALFEETLRLIGFASLPITALKQVFTAHSSIPTEMMSLVSSTVFFIYSYVLKPSLLPFIKAYKPLQV